MRLGRAIVMSCALLIGSSRTLAFQQVARSVPRQSKLGASFLDDIFEKTFSTMAGKAKSPYYTVGITGSSGLLGTAIIDELSKQEKLNGKEVRIVRFQRGENVGSGDDVVAWNPYGSSPEEVIDPAALESMDAVIHLAGENVATGLGPLGFLGIRPWTAEKKQEILKSRVEPTKGLGSAIAACSSPPDFLVASGVGVYGADFIGDESFAVDESMDTSTTGGFLAQVSREWEAAASTNNKSRVVKLRMGVVMSKLGGALGKLYPIFFLGGGGNVGSGQQYFSFLSARDAARAYVHVLSTPYLSGPVNVCSPEPCTNAEFTKALGKVLGRPTILPFPGFAVSLLFGEMGEEMLLGGVRAIPTKLMKSGFEFLHPTIEQSLQSAVDESI